MKTIRFRFQTTAGVLLASIPPLLAGSPAASEEPAPTIFRSAAGGTTLLELYTSEGCSSCPPADAWMSTLTNSPSLWQEMVPVVFHVGYWDQLGWPDRFASPEHADRQRAYAEQWHSSSIYTPEFVLGGKEWRSWRGLPGVSSRGETNAGSLEVRLLKGDRFVVNYRASNVKQQEYKATVAWLGFDLVTGVGAGENSGRTLCHNFVVQRLEHAIMRFDNDNAAGELTLARPSGPGSHRLAVAAWVSAGEGPAALQAAGGWVGPGSSSAPSVRSAADRVNAAR